MSTTLDVILEAGDITEIRADVVVLKHAQSFYGADRAVARMLETRGITQAALAAPVGEHRFVETRGALGAPLALFLGTVRLGDFGYHEIRQFAGRALTLLESRPGIRHVACTAHGPGYGLDEDEAILAFVGGLIEALGRGVGPQSLERVTVVELRQSRMEWFRRSLEQGIGKSSGVERLSSGWGYRVTRSGSVVQTPQMATAGEQSLAKPHAFVAMPFVPEMEDVYHYGIQLPVKAAGLLCERVDQDVFEGAIIQRIRERIETAKVVIADLSLANPNVYLEVGYAWGRGRPTILLVRDVRDLKFDVSSYRCLVYRNIRDLEGQLTRELQRLG